MNEMNSINDDIRVLVVDDDPFTRRYMCDMLDLYGLKNIQLADDGDQAIDVLKKTGADVVFADVYMEPMNGLELLKNIRVGTEDIPRDLPVVILTVSNNDSVYGAALSLDCSAFLAKPASQIEIINKLQSIYTSHPVIKPSIAYKIIPTTLNDQGINLGIIEEKLPKGAVAVELENLKPGYILANDIKTINGNVLLIAGTQLHKHTINRLREIKKSVGILRIAIQATSHGRAIKINEA